MNYYVDEPSDMEATFNVRTVYTAADIIESYGVWFLSRGLRNKHLLPRLQQMSYGQHLELIVEEWCIVNWAQPTDMPPGVYMTMNRRQ